MLKIGITGGIGAGKTTVAKVFEQLGIPVYRADDEAKKLYYTSVVKQQVVNLLGEDSYFNNGKLNKPFISSIVFSDKEALAKLNAIIHPAVANHFSEWVQKQNTPFILKEAAILFESGSHKGLDKVITVSASKQLRIDRVVARDSVTQKQVESRMQNQWTEKQRLQAADFIIYNDDSKLVIPQVLELYNELKS